MCMYKNDLKHFWQFKTWSAQGMTLCCDDMAAVSGGDAHQDLLVFATLNVSLAPSVLCLAHWWMEEAEAVTEGNLHCPARCHTWHRALLKQNCSLSPLSHSLSIRFRCLKINGFHLKRSENLHSRLVRERWASEQEKQKMQWRFFQVSCASQTRDLPLIPENIFTIRNW